MFNWFKKIFTSGGNSVWAIISGGAGGTSRIYLTKKELEALFYGWVFACVTARSEDVGAIELFLLKRTKNGVEEVYDHPLLDSLRGFNNTMTKSDGFSLLSAHLDIFGRGYWRIIKNGEKTTIMPLDPTTITPIEDEEGEIIGWKEIKINKHGSQQEIIHELGEIIPFREMNPFSINGYYSIVQAAFEWIETEINATNWNRSFFKNNAIPTTMLKTNKPINSEAQKRLKTSFEEAFSGSSNAHKVGVLPNGLEVIKLMESAKDMDFVSLDERYQNKILAMFRMPRSRLGITDDVNRANAEATDFIYMSRAINPRMKKQIDTLNEFYVPLWGDPSLTLGYKTPIPEDQEAKINLYKAGLANQPYMTVNEVRMKEGLAPIDGGDTVRTTMQFVDLGTVNEGSKKAHEQVINKQFLLKAGSHNHKRRNTKEAANNIASEFLKSMIKAAQDFASRDMDEQLHKQFVLRAEPYIKVVDEAMEKANKKIEKLIKKETPSLIDELKNKAILKKIESSIEKATLAIVFKATKNIFYTIATEESQIVQTNFNIVGDYVISSSLNKRIEEFTKKLAKSYAETTVTEIRDEIKTGLKDGLGIKEIERKIRNNVFDGKMKIRSEMISHTEVFRFSNLGLRDGYSESGVVSTVRWYTAEDERTCPFCLSLDGAERPVNKSFFEKGSTVIGTDGSTMKNDYSDVFGGPLHPRCRCYVRPEKISIV